MVWSPVIWRSGGWVVSHSIEPGLHVTKPPIQTTNQGLPESSGSKPPWSKVETSASEKSENSFPWPQKVKVELRKCENQRVESPALSKVGARFPFSPPSCFVFWGELSSRPPVGRFSKCEKTKILALEGHMQRHLLRGWSHSRYLRRMFHPYGGPVFDRSFGPRQRMTPTFPGCSQILCQESNPQSLTFSSLVQTTTKPI